VLQGEPLAEAGTGRRGAWVSLRREEHFPMRDAMALLHLLAPHHLDMLGREAQQAVWRRYAEQIRSRHNRRHPDQPIARVRLGVEVFPQSPAGYRAAKSAATTLYQPWFEAP